MSATTAVVNGVHPPAQGLQVLDEMAEFEKILKLRDEIFAGNHPRLTVPAHLRKVSPVSIQVSSHTPVSIPAQQQISQVPGLSVAATLDGARPQQSPLPVPLPKPPQSQQHPQPPPQLAPTASGINPVLLTKSAEVVKAESNLLRNRLEKQLRDQFEQKRADFRKRPAPAEARPDFDISTILAKAWEVVKPVSLSKESDKEEGNESFDENSFYSSRAPDSTPERPDQSTSSHDGEVHEDVSAETRKEMATQDVSFLDINNSPQIHVVGPQGAAAKSIPSNSLAQSRVATETNVVDVGDEDEEGEYSPPEAVDQPMAQNGISSQMIPDPRSRHLRKYSDLDQNNNKRLASPSDNMRIVRNHITSPFAPQPSRVSPLTLTKDSLVSQDRRYQENRHRGRANSPSQSPETVAQRNKKRKIARKEDKRHKKIKREDISPPPFHDIQPLGQNKLLPPDDRQTIIIDDLQPQPEVRYLQQPPLPPAPLPPGARYVEEPQHAQEIRYMPAPRYVEAPPRPLSRQPEVVPMSEPRVLSRASVMRPREEQDLRRVASMHNMRADQPREYVDPGTPTRQRAVSYMRVESPMREGPREYAADSDRPMQEVRIVRTPAPEYREVYSPVQPEVRYVQEPMLPPPPAPRERIVVDQYGRRFREIVAEPSAPLPRATSYAPREMSRYAETYAPLRAGSVMVEERPGGRYEHDMPPPPAPPLVRPGIEQVVKTPSATPREAYEPLSGGRMGSGQQAYDVRPDSRSGLAQAYERPRQAPYTDVPSDYRTPVRMSSVRPAPQYEEVMQVLPRAGSVRPSAREGSVYMDERGAVRREYIPMEQTVQPRYRVVEPEMQMPAPSQARYVDTHGREVVAAQQPDGGVRYVQRY